LLPPTTTLLRRPVAVVVGTMIGSIAGWKDWVETRSPAAMQISTHVGMATRFFSSLASASTRASPLHQMRCVAAERRFTMEPPLALMSPSMCAVELQPSSLNAWTKAWTPWKMPPPGPMVGWLGGLKVCLLLIEWAMRG
jgi:hypothetical protein